jgi:hypothetical protein
VQACINLLALPLDPADFFVKHPRPIPELFLAYQTLPVELGVVPYGGDTILRFILKCF